MVAQECYLNDTKQHFVAAKLTLVMVMVIHGHGVHFVANYFLFDDFDKENNYMYIKNI